MVYSVFKRRGEKTLKELYDWQDYGGHHLENRITSFAHGVYLPSKFNIDYRNNTLSAVVRNGEMDRDEAIDIYYNQPRYFEEDIVDYFKKRMSLSDQEYVSIMNSEPNYWYQFPTYKKRFESLWPLFKILASESVPMSFYLKYCFPSKQNNLK